MGEFRLILRFSVKYRCRTSATWRLLLLKAGELCSNGLSCDVRMWARDSFRSAITGRAAPAQSRFASSLPSSSKHSIYVAIAQSSHRSTCNPSEYQYSHTAP